MPSKTEEIIELETGGIVKERIDEKWNGIDIPIYHLTKRTGKFYWVSNIGTFCDLVPLLLFTKILNERDDKIKNLEEENAKLQKMLDVANKTIDVMEDNEDEDDN